MNNKKDRKQPNLETIEAIKESEQLIKDKNAKTYSTFSDILHELNSVLFDTQPENRK